MNNNSTTSYNDLFGNVNPASNTEVPVIGGIANQAPDYSVDSLALTKTTSPEANVVTSNGDLSHIATFAQSGVFSDACFTKSHTPNRLSSMGSIYPHAQSYDFNSGKTSLIPSTCVDVDEVFLVNTPNLDITSSRTTYSDNIVEKTLYSRSIDTNLTDHRLTINSGLLLPINTPIHLLCGSKDVIHSWAIPGTV